MTTLESDASVTFEDQNKINLFARTNALLLEAKEDLVQKKKDVVNLDDAESEILMSEDTDEGILYSIGEIFINSKSSQASEYIQSMKSALEEEIKSIEAKAETYKSTLSGLKVQLYAKFGNNINLEAEED